MQQRSWLKNKRVMAFKFIQIPANGQGSAKEEMNHHVSCGMAWQREICLIHLAVGSSVSSFRLRFIRTWSFTAPPLMVEISVDLRAIAIHLSATRAPDAAPSEMDVMQGRVPRGSGDAVTPGFGIQSRRDSSSHSHRWSQPAATSWPMRKRRSVSVGAKARPFYAIHSLRRS